MIHRPLFSGRLERERIVAWLRSERFKCDQSQMTCRQAAAEIADHLSKETDVSETQHLRDASNYPQPPDAARALLSWAQYEWLTDEERGVCIRIAERLATQHKRPAP